MGSDRRPVCHRCAQIKQACDGNLPCSRCTRLSLPCRPRDGTSSSVAAAGTRASSLADGEDAGSGAGSASHDVAPKARIRRVQTGCLMCKRRKKKCDESRPKCTDCRRLCLDCVWPSESHRAGGAQEKQQLPVLTHRARKDKMTKANGDVPARKERITPKVKSEERDVAILRHSPVEPSPIDTIVPMDSENSNTKALVDDGVFVEVNMDGLYGTDATQWEPSPMSVSWFDRLTPTSYRSASPEMLSATALSTYVPPMLPQVTSPYDRALLNHYTRIVSSILSRRASTSNPYNHHLLPMACSNDLVLHCILALAGKHWRKMEPSMATRGLLHQSKAQMALAQLLPYVDKSNADIALVSSLLLCMTELFDGASEGWKLHLQGAKRLLAALRRQHGESWTGHYMFLLRLARFLDSAATTSTCKPPLMEDEEREAAALDRMAASHDEDDPAVYGIPKELFHLVDRVNTLADKRKTRVDTASEAAFREEAALVEASLNEWKLGHQAKSLALRQTPPAATSEVAPGSHDTFHATTAFEWALRLRLHQIVEGYDPCHPCVTSALDGILDAVQKIRYGSPLETCLLFPLVMAGGACRRLEQQVVIQDRLLIMERTCGFGYVYNARELVELVWARRAEAARSEADGQGGEEVNWARIRYEEMNGLVVF